MEWVSRFVFLCRVWGGKTWAVHISGVRFLTWDSWRHRLVDSRFSFTVGVEYEWDEEVVRSNDGEGCSDNNHQDLVMWQHVHDCQELLNLLGNPVSNMQLQAGGWGQWVNSRKGEWTDPTEGFLLIIGVDNWSCSWTQLRSTSRSLASVSALYLRRNDLVVKECFCTVVGERMSKIREGGDEGNCLIAKCVNIATQYLAIRTVHECVVARFSSRLLNFRAVKFQCWNHAPGVKQKWKWSIEVN